MRGKIFLILLITVIIGIQPAFAQSGHESAKQDVPEKTVQGETVININLASDKEFIQALETAGDIELVNEETVKSDKDPNQGKPK